jgi:hypothetical protein
MPIELLERYVSKGFVNLTAATGLNRGKVSKDRVTYSPGNPSDSIFAYHSRIDATGETASDTIILTKQFSVMDIQMRGWTKGYGIMVRGNSCGFRFDGFSPVEGEFRNEPEMISAGIFRTLIPRQKDRSLCMDVLYNGKTLKTFPVGVALSKAVDWEKPNLDDISVVIDYAMASIRIKVIGWETGLETEVWI